MTRKCIYIFYDLIFKVTTYHYRIFNFKVTNKNGENYLSTSQSNISKGNTGKSHLDIHLKFPNFQTGIKT